MKSSAVAKVLLEETNNLSEEQKLFNKLVKQIEKKKKELSKWEQCAEDYKYKYIRSTIGIPSYFQTQLH